MDCCSINGLDDLFNRSEAQGELKRYLKKGISGWSREVRDATLRYDVAGASILDIGCGIGTLHLELLQKGAASAVGIDASIAQVEAARSLAEKLGLQDRVEYRAGDFVREEAQAPEADIVLLDKVICCYPHMHELVSASVRHARRLCVLAYPRVTWVTRAFFSIGNLYMRLRRRAFRSYLHSPEHVTRTMESLGFSAVFRKTYGPLGIWQVYVFRRD